MHTAMLRKAPILLVAALCLFTADLATAQDLHPSRRPSPIGIAKTHLGDTYIKVTYGRPYMRNRAIFGTDNDSTTFLVPFDQLWRTGANEATEITTTGALAIAGQRLNAGTYSIFTKPSATEWMIHLSPQLGLDGTGRLDGGSFTPNIYDADQDVLVITVPSGMLDEDVDQFTMLFEQMDGGTHLVMRWEKTEVRIPFGTAM